MCVTELILPLNIFFLFILLILNYVIFLQMLVNNLIYNKHKGPYISMLVKTN